MHKVLVAILTAMVLLLATLKTHIGCLDALKYTMDG